MTGASGTLDATLTEEMLGGLRTRAAAVVATVALTGGDAHADRLEERLRETDRHTGVALLYHVVGDRDGDRRREIIPAVGVDAFKRQLDHLARRFDVVAASRLPAAASARKPGQRFPVAITFDDNAPSNVEVAAPALREYGLPATFYLLAGGPQTWWWESLQRAWDGGHDLRHLLGRQRDVQSAARAIRLLEPRRRAEVAAALNELTGYRSASVADDVRALHDFEIGFHTVRHDSLTQLDDDALDRAMEHGRAELEELSGDRLTTIAYPHGKADERVAAAARAAAFRSGYTTRAEPIRAGGDQMLLGRIEPSPRFAMSIVRTLAA